MPTSGHGSEMGPQARAMPGPSPEGSRKIWGGPASSGARGFTLIELLVVVAILALTTSLVSLALRDSREQQLEREGVRLALLLETARAESRASGLPVWWAPAPPGEEPGFRFVGLTARQALPGRWLESEVRAEVEGLPRLQLGPEALIGAQRVRLRLGDREVTVETDGLAPFDLRAGDAP
jgi:general secretion pathway protein H